MSHIPHSELDAIAAIFENRAKREGWRLVAAILVMGLTFLAGYLVTP